MGAVINGATFPGRMISWAGAVCFGETTDTGVRATCAVSAFSVVRALTRDQIPETNKPATTINEITKLNHRLCGRSRLPASLDGSVCPPICFFSSVSCDIETPVSFVPNSDLLFVPDAGVKPAKH